MKDLREQWERTDWLDEDHSYDDLQEFVARLLREIDRLREALESIKANGCGDAAEKCAACMAIDALEFGAISEDQTPP